MNFTLQFYFLNFLVLSDNLRLEVDILYQLCYTVSSMKIEIDISGDLAGVYTLAKQIEFGVAKTLTDTAKRAQSNIIEGLKAGLHVRSDWYSPSRQTGIRVTTASRKTLEASIYTTADWLLEEEGYHEGVKTPEKGGSNLAIPDIEHTRHGIDNKVQKGEKARALLNNSSRTKAFKIRTKGGFTLILQRVGLDANGGLLQSKRGGYLRGRGKGRQSTLVTKYIFKDSVKVPQKKIFTRIGTATVIVQLPSYLRQNIENALKSARI